MTSLREVGRRVARWAGWVAFVGALVFGRQHAALAARKGATNAN